ncbi:MAG TPA: YggS family pyridoxal phosphate-dependent enzyme [Gammaproteobacteria bacterium]|nr:YggS family pyridoxal phosphate-dependent enzyme [Gammaproteobacteria bacterium]
MNTIAQRFAQIRARITQAEQRYQREPGSVKLLAVSKTRPLAELQTLIEHGQQTFAENYLQDALPKIAELPNPVEWHFIGPLQSNKTRQVAEHFHWLHTLERLKIARRLNDQRADGLAPLNVCIQVNISADPDKSGLTPEAAEALAHELTALPRLRLRGLMTLPRQQSDFERQRQPFRELHALYTELCRHGFELDTLSMGMTGDLEAAIAEGSTLVRIGTGLFGPRKSSQ